MLPRRIKHFLSYVLILWAFVAVAYRAQAQEPAIQPELILELGNKYFDAIDYLQKNMWIIDTMKNEGVSPDIALSAVIPSMLRYSGLRDIVETGAMRTLYIQSGRKYSHYSVGRFQMKASFAEMVERTYIRLKLGKQKFIVSNSSKARAERAKRLESKEWQVQYLIMFYKIMEKRYAHIEWKNKEDKARFYATAYDVGFNRDERTIRRMMSPKTTNRRVLNRKVKNVNSKYRTGDVAVWFIMNDAYKFVP